MLDVRKLQRKLRKKDTAERCGLILESGKIVDADNRHKKPEQGFEIEARDILQPGVVATWHTHPNQSSALSHDDYRGFLNWPDLRHFIIGTDGVRCYFIDSGIVREIPLAAD